MINIIRLKPIKKVLLANAGNDDTMSSIANDYSFPALGVLSLGTWLARAMPQLELTVRDGGAISQEELIKEIERVKPDLLGVSTLSTSYQNSLELAEAAKGVGAKVVFGNDHAAQLGRRILERRRDVDYIIGHEYGEKPLEQLVRALNGEGRIADVESLTYREGSDIRGFDYDNPEHKRLLSIRTSPIYGKLNPKGALDAFPTPDRTLFPKGHWDSYLKNYLQRFAHLHEGEEVNGVTTMNRARGCSRARELLRCNFCDMLLDPAFSSAEAFWKDVQAAKEQVDADIFYEVCDSLSSFPSLLKELNATKPERGFAPKFFIYAQAKDLVRRPELVEQFKELGVYRTNIGIEAGSNATLKHMKGEHDSVATNYEALRMLKDAGIHVYGSFVLGSEAETPATLSETVDWAKRIMDEGLIADVEAQPVLPLPQNRQGRQLREAGERFDEDWPINIDELSQRYIDGFSDVSYEQVLGAANDIRDHAARHRLNYGSGVSRRQNYRK